MEIEDDLVTLMPFGKHKGKPICRVPVGYLKWYLENSEDTHGILYKILFEVSDDIYNACADDCEMTLEDYYR